MTPLEAEPTSDIEETLNHSVMDFSASRQYSFGDDEDDNYDIALDNEDDDAKVEEEDEAREAPEGEQSISDKHVNHSALPRIGRIQVNAFI